MNWLNTIIISIGAALSSLLGISHPAQMNSLSSSTPTEQVSQISPATVSGSTYMGNGYSIQYPIGWTQTKAGSAVILKSPDSTAKRPINVAIDVIPSGPVLNAAYQVAQFSKMANLGKSTIQIGSITATEFTDTTSDLAPASFVIFENNGNIYNLSVTGVDSTRAQSFYESFKSSGQVVPASQTSDEQNIISTVTAMLTAERNATTFQDAEKAVTDYASQGAIQQFQAGIGKVPASSLATTQNYILQVDHAYPDPGSFQLDVVINGTMATATAALPDTTTTQPNAPGKVIVSTFHNSITVPLQKENEQWKVIKIIMASKGTGSVIKASQ